jgi:hypothetical protein
MTEEMRAKRQHLKAISALAKEKIQECKASSINEGIKLIYKEQGHEVLKTFNQWRTDGFKVKKGSKALLLWGSPVNATKKAQAEGDQDTESEFFPVSYLFSNQHVEPVK